MLADVAEGIAQIADQKFWLLHAWEVPAWRREPRSTRSRAIVNVDAVALAGLRAQLGADVDVMADRQASEGWF